MTLRAPDWIPGPRIPVRDEPWGRVGRQVCPLCGKAWFPWAGSLLPCHARCLYDDENLDRLAEIAKRREVTLEELARHQGISVAALRALLRRHYQRPRGPTAP